MTRLLHDCTEAARLLRLGQLVAFPTETVYGLGALARDDRAVGEVFAQKGRPSFNPLIVHVSSLEQALELADFSSLALGLATSFWPGPLTLVLPRKEGSGLSPLATAGLSSVALRVPAHPVARELLHRVGAPLVAPSANPSGYLSPTTSAHVQAHLGGKIAAVLEGGPCRVGLESTVVAVLEEDPTILRFGGISRDVLDAHLGKPLKTAVFSKNTPLEGPRSPGQLMRHYAPKIPLRLGATSMEEGEGLLAFGLPDFKIRGPVVFLSRGGDVTEAASRLFSALHDLEAEKIDRIAVMPLPEEGLGAAINDRLRRGALG